MSLIQLLNQEYCGPEHGWVFCVSGINTRLKLGTTGNANIARMLLLKQLAGIHNVKCKRAREGYTVCLAL